MTTTLDYVAFGLRISSDIALPELFGAGAAGAADVSIRLGSIDGTDEPGLHTSEHGTLLVIDDVASYWVTGGSEIVAEPIAGVPDANVRLYLLGSAMGVLLHQRGLLPLHANSVAVGGGAVAFMGPSGAGKSTLAAWFHDHGFGIVADDVSVVTFNEADRPLVHPGIPRLRLWREALEASGRIVDEHPLSWRGDDSYQKYDVSILGQGACREARPLTALYLLAQGETFAIERIEGVEATDAIFANTYRGGYVPLANGTRNHWMASLQLVRTVPVFRVTRRWGLALLDEECGQIRAHAEQVGNAAADSGHAP